MTIVIFAISRTIYEISENQMQCQRFDLENEGQDQGGLAPFDWKCSILYRWFFQNNFNCSSTFLYANGTNARSHTHTTHACTHAHTYTHIHTQRKTGALTIGKKKKIKFVWKPVLYLKITTLDFVSVILFLSSNRQPRTRQPASDWPSLFSRNKNCF